MELGIKLQRNLAFSKIEIVLIYIVAIYLTVRGSFDMFSMIEDYHMISNLIMVSGIFALFALVFLSNGNSRFDGLLKLNAIFLIYEVCSFTILDISLIKHTLEPILAINLLYLFIAKTMSKSGYDELFYAFRNVVLLLGIGSVVMWIIGPILNIIPPSVTFYLDRGGEHESVVVIYHYVCCTGVNEREFLSFILPPNNCIFREKAFAASTFFLALSYEMFLNRNKSYLAIIILYIALFSTTSTTAIAVGTMAGYFLGANRKGGLSLKWLLLLPIAFLVVNFLQDILQAKFETHSGGSRYTDLMNGIQGWMDSPLFGHGFNNQDAYEKYKTGYSNSVARILISGGIYLACLYITPVYKAIRRGVKQNYMELSAFAICVSLPLLINRGCFNINIFFIFLCLNYVYATPKYQFRS